MGVPARFAGVPLRASRKPTQRDDVLELIQFGFPKRLKSLAYSWGAFLSETAGAGNGSKRLSPSASRPPDLPSQHRRVKDEGSELPFGSDLDGRNSESCAGGRV